jgi:hypothetical protein
VKLLADEDFDNRILRALMRRRPDLDIVRAQDVGLSGAPDPDVLQWAADHDRILLSHDVSTMTRYAYDRLRAGSHFAGMLQVPQRLGIGPAVDDILITLASATADEWKNRIFFLPL